MVLECKKLMILMGLCQDTQNTAFFRIKCNLEMKEGLISQLPLEQSHALSKHVCHE